MQHPPRPTGPASPSEGGPGALFLPRVSSLLTGGGGDRGLEDTLRGQAPISPELIARRPTVRGPGLLGKHEPTDPASTSADGKQNTARPRPRDRREGAGHFHGKKPQQLAPGWRKATPGAQGPRTRGV